ncbi:hypothetical protein KI387_021367, partial [Taxus chinensis]
HLGEHSPLRASMILSASLSTMTYLALTKLLVGTPSVPAKGATHLPRQSLIIPLAPENPGLPLDAPSKLSFLQPSGG